MSTFGGKVVEIPDISIDNFGDANLDSTIYFLSHCHTDHMRGLEDWGFHKSLVQRPNVFLYASPISVKILKGYYPAMESKLKEIPLDSPTLIKFPYRNDFLTVTPLPAGHCPGSVMFLFETDKRILYTGDYRVNWEDLKKYKAFYSLDKIKSIDKLYLDTTFFKPSFLKWPLREDSVESICKIIKDWVFREGKNHIIKIALSATYGSEYLFMEISRSLGMPIHVSSKTYDLYKYIPEMDEAVTLNPRATQIHAGCGYELKKICCENNSDVRMRVVIPSALWWENNDFSKGIVSVTNYGGYRVCYSCHAAFEEIKEFVLFLKPKEIEPCVVPKQKWEKERMLGLLDDVMAVYKNKQVPEEEEEEEAEVKLFNTEGCCSNIKDEDRTTPVKDVSDDLDDLLCSPKNNFKRKRLWLNDNNELD